MTRRVVRNALARTISALTYRWTYLRVVQRCDDDLFDFLGDRLAGARVVDCGSGPGLTSEKLLRSGVAALLAVDASGSMVRQARARLAPFSSANVQHRLVDEGFFQGISGWPHIVLFKRSLYAARPGALATLRAAVAAVDPPGLVVVVHPESSLRCYAFGRPARWRRFTAFHLFNRFVSAGVARLGFGEYRLYRHDELLALLTEAAQGRQVVQVPVSQDAYNIAAIMVRDGPRTPPAR